MNTSLQSFVGQGKSVERHKLSSQSEEASSLLRVLEPSRCWRGSNFRLALAQSMFSLRPPMSSPQGWGPPRWSTLRLNEKVDPQHKALGLRSGPHGALLVPESAPYIARSPACIPLLRHPDLLPNCASRGGCLNSFGPNLWKKNKEAIDSRVDGEDSFMFRSQAITSSILCLPSSAVYAESLTAFNLFTCGNSAPGVAGVITPAEPEMSSPGIINKIISEPPLVTSLITEPYGIETSEIVQVAPRLIWGSSAGASSGISVHGYMWLIDGSSKLAAGGDL